MRAIVSKEGWENPERWLVAVQEGDSLYIEWRTKRYWKALVKASADTPLAISRE